VTPSPSGGLVVARIVGHRGVSGEVTARVASGDAGQWVGLKTVTLRGGAQDGRRFEVEAARAYRDRLVLKLKGIENGDAAAGLRGADIVAAAEDVPALPEGRYWLDALLGATVIDDRRGVLGTVADVIETGGGEVLSVTSGEEGGDEILIPLVRAFVHGFEADRRTIRVRVPDDLLWLNRDREA